MTVPGANRPKLGEVAEYPTPSGSERWIGTLVHVTKLNGETVGAGIYRGYRYNPDLPMVTYRTQPPPWFYAFVFDGWECPVRHREVILFRCLEWGPES